MKKDDFIVALEGIDGAGKTTVINEICRYFGGKSIVYKRTNKGRLMDKILSSSVMQKYYLLQIPIYLILSYKNFLLFKLNNKSSDKVIIMDRCFLSNICYFCPKALKNKRILSLLLFFEVKMFPQKIFILDVAPIIGQKRDLNKKSLKWLTNTRNAYLEAIDSSLLKMVKIELIPKELTIEKKCNIIINYIKGEKIW